MRGSLSKVRGAPQPERYVAIGETQGSAPAPAATERGGSDSVEAKSKSPPSPPHRQAGHVPQPWPQTRTRCGGPRARHLQTPTPKVAAAWHRAAGAEGRARGLTRGGRPGVGPRRSSWMAARLTATAPRMAPGHLPQTASSARSRGCRSPVRPSWGRSHSGSRAARAGRGRAAVREAPAPGFQPAPAQAAAAAATCGPR